MRVDIRKIEFEWTAFVPLFSIWITTYDGLKLVVITKVDRFSEFQRLARERHNVVLDPMTDVAWRAYLMQCVNDYDIYTIQEEFRSRQSVAINLLDGIANLEKPQQGWREHVPEATLSFISDLLRDRCILCD